MNSNRLVASSLALASLAVLPLVAAAQATGAGSPQRVEVHTAQAADQPRRDVDTVCPKIQQELPEVLASAWAQVGQPGVVRVKFRLEGSQVVDVTPVSGPRRYRHWVRSAMQDVSCRSDRLQAQVFQFDIRFIDIYDTPEHRTVAVLLP